MQAFSEVTSSKEGIKTQAQRTAISMLEMPR